METTIKMTAELWNLLTLPMDDQLDDFTREDIIKLITMAWESVRGE